MRHSTVLCACALLLLLDLSGRRLAGAQGGYQLDANWPVLSPNPKGPEWEFVAVANASRIGALVTFRRADPPIVVFDSVSGRITRTFGDEMFVWPHGIKVDRDGNVWAVDATLGGDPPYAGQLRPAKEAGHGYQVVKFGSDGQVLLALGKAGVRGQGQDRFDSPTDVAFAPNGDIFVTDGHDSPVARVVKFSKDGKFVRAWGTRGKGPGEFNYPHGIALDSSGRVFVADRHNGRIQIFDQQGRFLAEWPQFGFPAGLAIAEDDTMVVSDTTNSRLTIGSAKDGSVAARIADVFAEGVAIDAAGSIFAAQPAARTVAKFSRR